MANEAKVVGTVALMEGAAFAQNQAGERRQLAPGDAVHEGEVIISAAGGRVELALDQGGKLLLAQGQTVTLDSTVVDSRLSDGNSSALLPQPGELTSIVSALNQGSSLDALLKEVLSGVDSNSRVSGVSNMASDGSTFVQIMRTVETLAPLSYQYSSLDQRSAGSTPVGRSVNQAGESVVSIQESITTPVTLPVTLKVATPGITATAAPVVTITEDTNNDGTISAGEIRGTVGVTVTIPAGAVAGDTLTVSGQTPVALTAAQITAGSLTFQYARPLDGATLTVTATLTDDEGDTSPAGSDSARMGDTTATLAPVVSITEDANHDGRISAAEMSGTVGVNVTIPVGAVPGDTLAVSGQTPVVLTALQIAGGSLNFEYTRPAEGATLTVTATLTDVAGNASPIGTGSAILDTTITTTAAPVVTITEDANHDGRISAAEMSGTVGVNVTIPVGAVPGDTLAVSGQTPVVLNALQIAGGSLNFEYTRPAEGATLTVTATLTDEEGDTSPIGTGSAILDTTATVISGASSAAITESNVAQTATGTLTATDVDGTANAFTAQTNVAGSSGFGSFSINAAGVWTYTMSSAHDAFVGGQTYTDAITVASADGTTQVITVSMLGTNEVPTITGAAIASNFSSLSIYAGSYFTTGDSSVVTGGVLSGTYTSMGAGAKVDGSIYSGGYTTTGATSAVTGATSTVSGSVLSGSYVTTGAGSIIRGAVAAVGAITEGAGSSAGSTKEVLPAALMTAEQSVDLQHVVDAQAALHAMGSGTALAATMGNATLVAGVYSAASFSTVAATTLTLDGQGLANQTWIFNITDVLALGAGSKIVLINAGEGASVLWNAWNGYASMGAGAEAVGTFFAKNYITAGADAIITGPNGSNGGLFAQSGYITFGAGAKVGATGNAAATSADLVTGTADAGSLVTLHSASSILGTVTADSTGHFSYTLTAVNVTTLSQEANKTITASITDTANHTVTSTAFTYNDQLGGSFGNDTLLGTAGSDTLKGGVGNDILQGGLGNDLLIGGDGADTFKWISGDQGTAGAPAVDVIKDFNLTPVASGGDMLDLRDLLVNESSGNLSNFLHFEKLGTDTIVHISTTGSFGTDPHLVGAPSSVVRGAENQKIVLGGIDMIGVHTTDQQVIQDLLTKGKLHTD